MVQLLRVFCRLVCMFRLLRRVDHFLLPMLIGYLIGYLIGHVGFLPSCNTGVALLAPCKVQAGTAPAGWYHVWGLPTYTWL